MQRPVTPGQCLECVRRYQCLPRVFSLDRMAAGSTHSAEDSLIDVISISISISICSLSSQSLPGCRAIRGSRGSQQPLNIGRTCNSGIPGQYCRFCKKVHAANLAQASFSRNPMLRKLQNELVKALFPPVSKKSSCTPAAKNTNCACQPACLTRNCPTKNKVVCTCGPNCRGNCSKRKPRTCDCQPSCSGIRSGRSGSPTNPGGVFSVYQNSCTMSTFHNPYSNKLDSTINRLTTSGLSNNVQLVDLINILKSSLQQAILNEKKSVLKKEELKELDEEQREEQDEESFEENGDQNELIEIEDTDFPQIDVQEQNNKDTGKRESGTIINIKSKYFVEKTGGSSQLSLLPENSMELMTEMLKLEPKKKRKKKRKKKKKTEAMISKNENPPERYHGRGKYHSFYHQRFQCYQCTTQVYQASQTNFSKQFVEVHSQRSGPKEASLVALVDSSTSNPKFKQTKSIDNKSVHANNLPIKDLCPLSPIPTYNVWCVNNRQCCPQPNCIPPPVSGCTNDTCCAKICQNRNCGYSPMSFYPCPYSTPSCPYSSANTSTNASSSIRKSDLSQKRKSESSQTRSSKSGYSFLLKNQAKQEEAKQLIPNNVPKSKSRKSSQVDEYNPNEWTTLNTCPPITIHNKSSEKGTNCTIQIGPCKTQTSSSLLPNKKTAKTNTRRISRSSKSSSKNIRDSDAQTDYNRATKKSQTEFESEPNQSLYSETYTVNSDTDTDTACQAVVTISIQTQRSQACLDNNNSSEGTSSDLDDLDDSSEDSCSIPYPTCSRCPKKLKCIKKFIQTDPVRVMPPPFSSARLCSYNIKPRTACIATQVPVSMYRDQKLCLNTKRLTPSSAASKPCRIPVRVPNGCAGRTCGKPTCPRSVSVFSVPLSPCLPTNARREVCPPKKKYSCSKKGRRSKTPSNTNKMCPCTSGKLSKRSQKKLRKIKSWSKSISSNTAGPAINQHDVFSCQKCSSHARSHLRHHSPNAPRVLPHAPPCCSPMPSCSDLRRYNCYKTYLTTNIHYTESSLSSSSEESITASFTYSESKLSPSQSKDIQLDATSFSTQISELSELAMSSSIGQYKEEMSQVSEASIKSHLRDTLSMSKTSKQPKLVTLWQPGKSERHQVNLNKVVDKLNKMVVPYKSKSKILSHMVRYLSEPFLKKPHFSKRFYQDCKESETESSDPQNKLNSKDQNVLASLNLQDLFETIKKLVAIDYDQQPFKKFVKIRKFAKTGSPRRRTRISVCTARRSKLSSLKSILTKNEKIENFAKNKSICCTSSISNTSIWNEKYSSEDQQKCAIADYEKSLASHAINTSQTDIRLNSSGCPICRNAIENCPYVQKQKTKKVKHSQKKNVSVILSGSHRSKNSSKALSLSGKNIAPSSISVIVTKQDAKKHVTIASLNNKDFNSKHTRSSFSDLDVTRSSQILMRKLKDTKSAASQTKYLVQKSESEMDLEDLDEEEWRSFVYPELSETKRNTILQNQRQSKGPKKVVKSPGRYYSHLF